MSSIKVILLDDAPNLGNFGDVVSVKRGHARNHLLPTGQACTYTPEAMAKFEKEKKKLLKERQEARASLEQLRDKLDGYILQSVYQAQENGVMYGSVTQSAIVDLLKANDITIKRNQVQLPNNEPIKTIGEHDVVIKFDSDLSATMKLSALSDSH